MSSIIGIIIPNIICKVGFEPKIYQKVSHRTTKFTYNTKNNVEYLIIDFLNRYNVLMSPPNLERSLEISRLCQSLISLNSQIQFASVINKNGRMLDSKLRNESTITKLSSKEFEMLFMQLTLQTSMNKEHDSKLGIQNYTIIDREYAYELIFPFYDGITLVITNTNISINDLARKISKLIKEFEFGSEVKVLK